NGLIAIGGHGPFTREASDAMHEVGKQPRAVARMPNRGMELHGVETALLVGDRRKGGTGRRTDDAKPFRKRGDAVSVAHPDLMARALGPDAIEQGAFILDLQEGASEFAMMAAFHLAAELRAHGLLAIADAKDRNVGLEDRLRGTRTADVDGGSRAAGEDHRLRGKAAESLLGRLERNDLGIDAGLAHATRYELRHLAAEVDDKDGVGMSCLGHGEPLVKEASRRNGCQAALPSPPSSRPTEIARESRNDGGDTSPSGLFA